MVGMCLAAASWQSKNGLLVTLPPSQLVAGLRLHHLQLLPTVAMVEIRLAAASQLAIKELLAALFSLQTTNFDKDVLRGGSAVLEWTVSFQTPFRTVPYPFQTRTTQAPLLTHSRRSKWQVFT